MKNNRYLLILGSVASLLLIGVLALVLLGDDLSPVYLEEPETSTESPDSNPEKPETSTELPDSNLEEPEVSTGSPDDRLPSNWIILERHQKIQLDYHRCLSADTISQDNGRCLIDRDPETRDFDGEFEAEYVYISRSGPQAYFPMPEASYIYVAVPDSATDEQVETVFKNYAYDSPRRYDDSILTTDVFADDGDNPFGLANRLGMFSLIIYNYSDVRFDDDYYHGREFTGDPRTVYAFGLGGVRYEYLGGEVFAAGRDGADLASNCIALDLSFLILSESSPDQLQTYYADDDSLFQAVLNQYLDQARGYDLRFPKQASQKRNNDNVNYDILIKLYQADPKKHYLDLHETEYDETYRHSDLPSIAVNGCQ